MNKEKAPEGANKNNQVDDNTKRMVLSMLTTKPQSRYILASAIGISERTFRAAVHDLRLEKHPICTDPVAGGYYFGTKDDCKREARLNYAKAYDLLRVAKALEGVDPDQITMEEVMEL